MSLLDVWDPEEKEAEMPFYRRCATVLDLILDLIFKDTDILMNEYDMQILFIHSPYEMLSFHSSYFVLLLLLLLLFSSGEAGSPATKNEIATNKVLFMANDVSPAYSRKIDLLLKCKEIKTAVELASNE